MSFIPKNSYNKEELLDCAQGNLFGQENGRLPSPNMLMFDRISTINTDGGKFSKGEIIAELDVNPDLWFFDCHFKGDPVMPGCLGLDAMWQLVGFYLCWLGNPGQDFPTNINKSLQVATLHQALDIQASPDHL